MAKSGSWSRARGTDLFRWCRSALNAVGDRLEASGGAHSMKTVEVRLTKDASLGNELADICDWLSREHCEPGMSSCRAVGELVIVRVVFAVSRDGDAFAKRFDGRIVSQDEEGSP